jgi:tetratricopeptide (TPR) repeat protein
LLGRNPFGQPASRGCAIADLARAPRTQTARREPAITRLVSRPRRPGEGEPDEVRPRRNVIDRAQLRAALALEEAGELQEAARMFEYVGEHAQAASLRLEHADTLRDEQQRLAVLREGCARNPATSVQGQALHRALGEALLRVAEGLEPGARRRALALEAAQALEDGQRPGEAGRLYEQLGLLTRAAKAYTEAGDIERLESVHAILEQREQRQRELRNLELEVEAAMATGRRSLALTLLLEHNRDAAREGRSVTPALAQSLTILEQRLLRERAFVLIVRTGQAPGQATTVVRVIGRPTLRLGRGPQCELSVSGAAISREHVELALAFGDAGDPRVVVRDLGSRAGSFLDGEALSPGEDWSLLDEQRSELALGIASNFDLHVCAHADAKDPRPVVLLREAGLAAPDRLLSAWTVFAPLGGPLWITPTQRLPLTLEFEAEQIVARASADVLVSLAGAPVGPGEPVELLVHDRVRFEPGGRNVAAFELEVVRLWG